MTVNASQLLKRLNPAVQPSFSGGAASRGTTPIDQQSFEQLLSSASRGGIVSGRQVQVNGEVQPPLDAEQLERLASAADQAEASGSKRALMVVDGRSLVMDVGSRTIEAEVNDQRAAAAFCVDSAIRVAGDVSARSAPLKYPSPGVLPPSIAKQFLKQA